MQLFSTTLIHIKFETVDRGRGTFWSLGFVIHVTWAGGKKGPKRGSLQIRCRCGAEVEVVDTKRHLHPATATSYEQDYVLGIMGG